MLITKKYLKILSIIFALLLLAGCSDRPKENTNFEKDFLEDLSEKNSQQPGAGFMVEPEEGN